jgi:hypothetical protein
VLSKCNTFDYYVFDVATANEYYEHEKAKGNGTIDLTPEELTKRSQEAKKWHADNKKQHNTQSIRDSKKAEDGAA